ncbi:MAG TPA: oligopeptide/dipeptide ABC transporter ATP-binding protein [Anaerolineales bacterium]|nr:oligopeptide/dipeptide ABC transporter ATP-binding protein [Anaerolineales bacterium]
MNTPTPDGHSVLLDVRDLKVHFPIFRGFPVARQVGAVKAVDGITFNVRRGETVGLVGESGCGKSTTGLAVIKMNPITDGSVQFDGQALHQTTGEAMRQLRKNMQMVFQDPYASLNPRMTVEQIVGEPLIVHGMAHGPAVRERVQELLKVVGLDPRVHTRYPHEFSGGQRQRIGIARALGSDPIFVICDEPISALDVSIQAQIINLLEDLQEAFSLTYLFIAHDLAVVRHISDRIAVMYLGKIMEFADCHELYRNPQHPYTRALLAAVPIPNPKTEKQRERIVLKGEIPSPIHPPRGCRFNTRCPLAQAICFEEEPAYRELGQGHFVACHLVE